MPIKHSIKYFANRHNALGHPAHLDDFHANVKVVLLLLTTTSVLQPVDQGFIANFKACYLRRTFTQAVEETNNGLSSETRLLEIL